MGFTCLVLCVALQHLTQPQVSSAMPGPHPNTVNRWSRALPDRGASCTATIANTNTNALPPCAHAQF